MYHPIQSSQRLTVWLPTQNLGISRHPHPNDFIPFSEESQGKGFQTRKQAHCTLTAASLEGTEDLSTDANVCGILEDRILKRGTGVRNVGDELWG